VKSTPASRAGRVIPLVWIVPLLALMIASWLMWRELRTRGPEITIEFSDGSGLEAGKTTLDYNGIEVGTVQQVELKPALDGVIVRLRLQREAAQLAREGTQFWVVRPELSLGGIRGLETLVTGVHLNARAGDGPPASHFRGIDRPPPREDRLLGPAFVLEADDLGALSPGASVYYRAVKVGAVETSWLADDATRVWVRIRIFNPYAPLVRTNSRFWKVGGPGIKFSLFGGAKLENTSLESFFTGGVAFATPDERGQLAPVAEDGTRFRLDEEPEKKWREWRPQIPIAPTDSLPNATPRAAVDAALTKRNSPASEGRE
jgi:paraquat-inducible protein B